MPRNALSLVSNTSGHSVPIVVGNVVVDVLIDLECPGSIGTNTVLIEGDPEPVHAIAGRSSNTLASLSSSSQMLALSVSSLLLALSQLCHGGRLSWCLIVVLGVSHLKVFKSWYEFYKQCLSELNSEMILNTIFSLSNHLLCQYLVTITKYYQYFMYPTICNLYASVKLPPNDPCFEIETFSPCPRVSTEPSLHK